MPASRQRRQRLAAALHRQSILHACNRWKNAINCLMASPHVRLLCTGQWGAYMPSDTQQCLYNEHHTSIAGNGGNS